MVTGLSKNLRLCLLRVINIAIRRNIVHRHEPPVTDKPVKVLLHDADRGFVVVEKPGSIVS